MHNQRSSADAWITAALLATRLAFLLFSPAGLSGDAFGYVQGAQTIIDTGKLPPLRVQPWGFSILIAPLLLVSGEEIAQAVLVMNSIMDCSVVAILLHSAKRIFPCAGQRSPRLLCWLLATIQPFTAIMVTSVHTETAVMFLNFTGAWLLFTSSNHIRTACGLTLLGLASLLRVDILALNAVSVFIYLVFFGLKHGARARIKACFVFLTLPGLMLIYQFYSTREIGFVRYELQNPGYYTWMRTWFALDKGEHERFAWDVGTRDWFGFDISNYPTRAFGSIAERDRVSELLRMWSSEGYSTSVDQGFRDIGDDRFARHPMRSLLLIPSLRMAHFWINIDAAQSYLRLLPIQRPLSTIIVAFTVLLRLLFILMAGMGAYAIWLPQKSPIGGQLSLARFASLLVTLRTMELGALGIFAQAGLMEVRFVVVAFPFVILMSFWGLRFLSGREPNINSPISTLN